MRYKLKQSLGMLSGVCLLGLLVGCAMSGPRTTGQRPAEPAAADRAAETTRQAPARDREASPASSPVAGEAATASGTAAATTDTAAVDPIANILAERRRSDFPEVEFAEFGFTITEQVRIGSDARTSYERALALLRQQRYAEGIALLEDAVAAAPEATVPYIDLGIAYRDAGQLERSEAMLDAAARLSPDNPVVHNELGILYRMTGRFGQAKTSYERALAIFAGFHYARRNLAVLCDLYLADLDCALQHYTAYLDSVGQDSEAEIWIADLENRLASQGDR